jgi:hypothetical protein
MRNTILTARRAEGAATIPKKKKKDRSRKQGRTNKAI